MSQSDARSIYILSQLKVMILPFIKPDCFLSDGVMLAMIERMLLLYHTTLKYEHLDVIEHRLALIFRHMLNQKHEIDIDTIMCFSVHFSLQQFKFVKNPVRISAWTTLKQYSEKHMSDNYMSMFEKKRDFIIDFEKILNDKTNKSINHTL